MKVPVYFVVQTINYHHKEVIACFLDPRDAKRFAGQKALEYSESFIQKGIGYQHMQTKHKYIIYSIDRKTNPFHISLQIVKQEVEILTKQEGRK